MIEGRPPLNVIEIAHERRSTKRTNVVIFIILFKQHFPTYHSAKVMTFAARLFSQFFIKKIFMFFFFHFYIFKICKWQEKDQYGNEVQRMARPLPVEYLLVDVPATTPLQQQFTFTQYDRRQPFPVENRYLDGHLQDFNALSTYLSQWENEEYLQAMSDFHLLVYLYRMDMLPMRQHIKPLLEAVHTKNSSMAYNFKKEEVWKVLESLIQASSSGSG